MLCRQVAIALKSPETIETVFRKTKKNKTKRRKCFHCDHHNRSLRLQWFIVLFFFFFSERHNLPDVSGDVDGYYLGCNNSVSHSQTWASLCSVVFFFLSRFSLWRFVFTSTKHVTYHLCQEFLWANTKDKESLFVAVVACWHETTDFNCQPEHLSHFKLIL